MLSDHQRSESGEGMSKTDLDSVVTLRARAMGEAISGGLTVAIIDGELTLYDMRERRTRGFCSPSIGAVVIKHQGCGEIRSKSDLEMTIGFLSKALEILYPDSPAEDAGQK